MGLFNSKPETSLQADKKAEYAAKSDSTSTSKQSPETKKQNPNSSSSSSPTTKHANHAKKPGTKSDDKSFSSLANMNFNDSTPSKDALTDYLAELDEKKTLFQGHINQLEADSKKYDLPDLDVIDADDAAEQQLTLKQKLENAMIALGKKFLQALKTPDLVIADWKKELEEEEQKLQAHTAPIKTAIQSGTLSEEEKKKNLAQLLAMDLVLAYTARNFVVNVENEINECRKEDVLSLELIVAIGKIFLQTFLGIPVPNVSYEIGTEVDEHILGDTQPLQAQTAEDLTNADDILTADAKFIEDNASTVAEKNALKLSSDNKGVKLSGSTSSPFMSRSSSPMTLQRHQQHQQQQQQQQQQAHSPKIR